MPDKPEPMKLFVVAQIDCYNEGSPTLSIHTTEQGRDNRIAALKALIDHVDDDEELLDGETLIVSQEVEVWP